MLTDLEKKAISEHYQTLAQNLPGFRPRKAQREMLAAIANTLSQSPTAKEGEQTPANTGQSIAVIEGPTGVGKSVAYLLSGSIMAQSRGKKLLVSSATIALQEQLIERDLPFLAEKSGLQVTYALAKGRGRYLCPYRLYQITQGTAQGQLTGFDSPYLLNQKISREEGRLLEEMAEAFHARQFNGDRDTWAQGIAPELWSKVNNDRHGCLKAACPNRPECPFFLARDTLEEVDVIVANHDLLLADIQMGGGVILPNPEECFYCIDEAHHLPQKALSQFAAEHSLQEIIITLDKFSITSDKVAALTDKANLANLADETASALLDEFKQWENTLNCTDDFQADLSSESIWHWEEGKIPTHLQTTVNNTHTLSKSLLKHVYDLNSALSQVRRDDHEQRGMIDHVSSELGIIIARIERMNAVWQLMNNPGKENTPPLAKWLILKRQDKTDYQFCASPIFADNALIQGLWQRVAGAILTSATLRSLGNFQLLLRETGLNRLPETHTLALDSPFCFEKQAELYIPPLRANPKNAAAHTEEIIEWLPKLIDITEPIGTLILFSSRKQMHEVAQGLPENIRNLILMQGNQPKSQLIQNHYQALANEQASIIFGLDSFAEGLDLPDKACVHVIIAKLPFAMPNHPIDKTRNQWIEKNGGNPFLEVSVPQASVKLTQAVGRLIRSETDYGRVTILDTRLQTARYGRQILASLPPFQRI